jgi:hypothetical protein
MIEALAHLWEDKARAALAFKELASKELASKEELEPILEALALSVALELTGDLAEVSSTLREQLRQLGQRTLLHVGAHFGGNLPGEDPDEAEEREEAMRLAIDLARDGLRALSGRPAQDAKTDGGSLPTTAEIARFISANVEPYEAAFIAQRIRVSSRAREELTWLLNRGREEIKVKLAAKASETMRDPGTGTRLYALVHPVSGASLAEIFGFPDRILAAYASSAELVRVEGEGVLTDTMQVGYWAGRHDGRQIIEGTMHVGDVSERFRIRVE